jgi:selenocysteine lyase/cysteine desulfurase
MRLPIDLAALRKREFARLDKTGSVYLDYTGSALYPASLVSRDARRLASQVLGNPHAESSPSLLSTEAMEKARFLTLQLLDADPDEYQVIFTANATSAIRILAEAFPFRRGSRLVLTADNHNSVNGLRLPARKRKAAVDYVPLDSELRGMDPLPWLTAVAAPSLFAFPAQSNFSGVQHSLAWVRQAQQQGYAVLIDAAAYVSSTPLSLSEVPADFVALSFYKLFGYPTGVGALVVRKKALSTLRRGYFSGGTVDFVSVQNRVVRRKSGSEAFEDGTPNFLAMPAVCDGLNWLREVGVSRVRDHCAVLTQRLLERLVDLGHRVCIYGPKDTEKRGSTITFNLHRAGRLVPFEEVETAARTRGIALRGGCFCNPGAAEKAFAIPAERARACMRGAFSIPRFRKCIGKNPVGAVRVSPGLATSMADLDSLFAFLTGLTAG